MNNLEKTSVADAKISLCTLHISNVDILISITFQYFCEIISSPNERIRNAIKVIRKSKNKKEIQVLKANLGYVCLSGTFGKRSTSELILHSGLMQINIDAKYNAQIDFNELREKLKKDVFICAVFESARGINYGIKAVLRVPPCETAYQHNLMFSIVGMYFQTMYNVQMGINTYEVSRACYLSHDENIYTNFFCEEFSVDFAILTKVKQKFLQMQKTHNITTPQEISYYDFYSNVTDHFSFIHLHKVGFQGLFIFYFACMLCELGVEEEDTIIDICEKYDSVESKPEIRGEVRRAYDNCIFNSKKHYYIIPFLHF